jgi:SAM-dependent methyltransferase
VNLMRTRLENLSNTHDYALKYSSFELSKLEEYRERVALWNIDLRGASVLDLGAGPGVWELIFSQAGATLLTWQDYSAEFEDFARALHRQHAIPVKYRRADLLDLAGYLDGEFDLVFSRDTLRYARNEWLVLKEIARIASKYLYVESASWRWSWRAPQGLSWKTAVHLLSPGLAIATRNKLLPTHWQSRWFVTWRLQRYSFRPIWTSFGPHYQSWRVLFQKQQPPALSSE